MSTGTTGSTLITTNSVFTGFGATDFSVTYEDTVGNYPNSQTSSNGYSGSYDYINLYKSNGLQLTTTNTISGITGATANLSYSLTAGASGSIGQNAYFQNVNITIPTFYYKYNTFRDVQFNLVLDTTGQGNTLDHLVNTNYGYYSNLFADPYVANISNGYSSTSTVDTYSTGKTGAQYQDTNYKYFVLQINTGDFSSSNLNPFTNSSANGDTGNYYNYTTVGRCNSNNAGWFNLTIAPRSYATIVGLTGATCLSTGFFNGDFSATIYDDSSPSNKTNNGSTGSSSGSQSTLTISDINLYNTDGTLVYATSETISSNYYFNIEYTVTNNSTSVESYNTNATITLKYFPYNGDIINTLTFTSVYNSSDSGLLDYIKLYEGMCLDTQSPTFTCTSLDANSGNNPYPLYIVLGSGYDTIKEIYGTVPSVFQEFGNTTNPFTNQGSGTAATVGKYCSTFLSNSCSSINSGWFYIYSLP